MSDVFSKGGLIIPPMAIKKQRVQIFFCFGGRVTVECGPEFSVTKNEDGSLKALNLDSESQFAFIDLKSVQAIEVIKP